MSAGSLPIDTAEPHFRMVQSSFDAGMNQDLKDVFLPSGEYPMAINCDNRLGGLTPVHLPSLDQEDLPTGKKQGIYGFNDNLIVFVAGQLWRKSVNMDKWVRVFPFVMDAGVDRIYVAAVPASTFNYERVLPPDTDISSIKQNNNIVGGTEAGLVVQDGVNQPWLITPDWQARPLQTYDNWTLAGNLREYVPIGKQMLFKEGILFIASPDGDQLYRSVTGRPLDFVVRVDANGDKGGDATTVSYDTSDDPITSLSDLGKSVIFVGSSDNSYVVSIVRDQTVFGEPTFRKEYSLNAGTINHFSTIPLLGDFGFVDYDGVRSFNAVAQENDEGRFEIFSRKIRRLLEDVEQDPLNVCAVATKGLAYIHLKTTTGNGILTYDIRSQRWMSLHQFPGINSIKQMTVFRASRKPVIYAISDDDKVYKMYDPAAGLATAVVYTRAAVAYLERNLESALDTVEYTIDEIEVDGQVTVTPIVDNVESQHNHIGAALIKTRPIQFGDVFPIGLHVLDNVVNARVSFDGLIHQAWKLGAKIEWNSGGSLNRIAMFGNIAEPQLSPNTENS